MDYYYLLHPPRERDEVEELEDEANRVIDFDKISPAKKRSLGARWSQGSFEGDLT